MTKTIRYDDEAYITKFSRNWEMNLKLKTWVSHSRTDDIDVYESEKTY